MIRYAGFNDWIKINFDSKSDTKLQINFEHKSLNTALNFSEASILTANKLAETYPKLYLSFSGGMDSEHIANTLLDQKIPFTPVLCKLDNFNADELWYAEYWCYKNNIKPILLELSERTLVDYIKDQIKIGVESPSVGSYITLYISDIIQQQGTIITGLSDINFDLNTKEFFSGEVDFIGDIYRPKLQPTGFFSLTPELVYSYIKSFDTSISEQYNKCLLYNANPRNKISYLFTSKLTNMSSILKKIFYYGKFVHGSKEQLLNRLSFNCSV